MKASKHWPAFEAAFGLYTRNLFGRRFARLRVRGNVPAATAPHIIASQHVAWWDPLTLFLLAREWFPPARHDAMMDARNLAKYPFFGWIGAFGVDRDSRAGAARSMRHALSLLETPKLRLVIFPQGEQESMDARPLKCAPGTSWLAMKGRATFSPVALRYEFIEDERPEVFVSIGEPERVAPGAEKAAHDPIIAAITREADRLRDDVYARNFGGFTTLAKRSRR
jgi:1-acyl-sn-glycerol-3-phosphate acyltransferase